MIPERLPGQTKFCGVVQPRGKEVLAFHKSKEKLWKTSSNRVPVDTSRIFFFPLRCSLTLVIALVLKEKCILKVNFASLIIKNADFSGAAELQAGAAMRVSVCGNF